MSQELTILGISAAITAGIQLSGFAVAFALQTEKFYDILGGVNFLTLGVYSAIDGEFEGGRWVEDPRKIACTAIFTVSRLWLLLFLAWRAHERNGDARFDEVKSSFGWFLVYWIFQGLWVVMISLPVIFVNSSDIPNNTAYTVLDFIGIIGFALGTLLEIFADVQKSLWVKAGRVGGFCTVGVWKYSRHPNYFGEILQWWCAWLFAFGSGTGLGDVQWWLSILSPLFTMQILLNTGGTGVMNANGKSLKRYYDNNPEEYAAYRKSTSILIPLPFGIYEYVPMFLKRTIFFDLKSYEYTPKNGETPDESTPDDETPNESTRL
jgi:steroid 5-alpha reductase family enzyme